VLAPSRGPHASTIETSWPFARTAPAVDGRLIGSIRYA
jgi:hypothetical protein